ncbi:hypothetical protein BDW71DRAFT_183711 [Aspergillus fruticulosus]
MYLRQSGSTVILAMAEGSNGTMSSGGLALLLILCNHGARAVLLYLRCGQRIAWPTRFMQMPHGDRLKIGLPSLLEWKAC